MRSVQKALRERRTVCLNIAHGRAQNAAPQQRFTLHGKRKQNPENTIFFLDAQRRGTP